MENKFQPNFEIIRLFDENKPPPPVTKVGILPFIAAADAGAWRFMVMKPQESAKHLGEPTFQLAKGTRRININECWCDMREDDLKYADASFWEPLVDTALREGREEIGLKPSNIRRMYDLGGFVFTSLTRNLKKPLHMFAAEMIDEKAFGGFEPTTAEARWMTLEEMREGGREDHINIICEALERLQKELRPES